MRVLPAPCTDQRVVSPHPSASVTPSVSSPSSCYSCSAAASLAALPPTGLLDPKPRAA